MKALEVSEEKAAQRQDAYDVQLHKIEAKLKEAETRAELSERAVVKLQEEVERLEFELLQEKEKHTAISREVDDALAEASIL